MERTSSQPSVFAGVAILAAATLCLESALTRLLAVAQFYHFAFLVISLSLLGFAASGTLLSISPRLRSLPIPNILAGSGVSFTAGVILAFTGTNWLPFDSYSIGIDNRQYLYFILYYLALSLPFLCSGVGIGAALSRGGNRGHIVYAANLLGSAGGAGLGLLLMALAGVPGALLGSAMLGLALPPIFFSKRHGPSGWQWSAASLVIIVIGLLGLSLLTVSNLRSRNPLGLVISPYKGLSYSRLYPGSRWLLGRWSATSRVDIIAQAGTRALPGLSYTYRGTPPEQLGLSVDADDLSPVTLVSPAQFEAASYLPEALVFELRPGASSLVLEPAAGLGILQALSAGAARITAVTSNALIPRAIQQAAPAFNPYQQPPVSTEITSQRVFLERVRDRYPVILAPLSEPYRPVGSGAYSLHETYALTVEAFSQALSRLSPDGILAVTRWMQTQPSESLRLATTLIDALRRNGIQDAAQALVIYRGVQTITTLVQTDGWTDQELDRVRQFTEKMRYDLVWAPDIRPDETNRFNRLPEASDYLALKEIFNGPDPEKFFSGYLLDVRPITDDHPFFFHFFTWEQIPEVLGSLGRTWQPFGGSGFLILFALLGLVILLSLVLVILPLLLPGKMRNQRNNQGSQVHPPRVRPDSSAMPGWLAAIILGYFTLIGLAYMLVEIPLIQRWILLLGNPTYAFSAVVVSILLFSSVGSLAARSSWLPRRTALAVLAVFALVTPWITQGITAYTLSWPVFGRLLVSVIGLAPLGILMGLPFPLGLQQMEGISDRRIAWGWAANGCASVIASVLAAILSLTRGFNAVLWLGALAYAGALGIYILWRNQKAMDGLRAD